VDNYEDRNLALEKIIQVVKSYIRSSISPSSTVSPALSDHSIPDHISNDEDNNSSDDEYSKQLFYYLLTILRLSISCPYSDVRQTFKDLLIGLKVRKYKYFLTYANLINKIIGNDQYIYSSSKI
jgi:hypothetical protein